MLLSRESVCWTLTGGENALDKLLSGHLAILIFVNAAEEVHDTRLFMVHPAHVALPPHIKVEVGKFLQLHIKNKKGDMRQSCKNTGNRFCVKPECLITSSSLSMASLSFLLLSKASSHTCCHLVTSRLTRGFLVSMGACVADAYMVCVGDRFPVSER